MSWIALSMLERRYGLPSDEQGEDQLGRLDEEDFLRWYTRFMDFSWLSSFGKRGPFPNEFVRCSDHGCVEYINVQLSTLKDGGISTEEFESKMRRLEERVIANMKLRPYAATLQKSEEIPLASETYLKLANRHALYGGKRTPSHEVDGQFARAMLDEVKDKAIWEMDVDVRTFATNWADMWLNDRDPYELQGLIDVSEVSVMAWDVLQMICQKAAGKLAGGLADVPEECLPHELLVWHLMAKQDHAERPDPEPAPRHRPEKLGYKVRDNEIRHTVDLLVQVGLTKTDAREVVADAVGRDAGTIQRICGEPYSTIGDLHLEAIKHMDPTYYSLYYGPDSNSDLPPESEASTRPSSG